MEIFRLKTKIHKSETFKDFTKEFGLGDRDLVLTNRFLYDEFMTDLKLNSRFIMQEEFGGGEPTDEMINSIIKEAKKVEYDRLIAVGGGTVLDIGKLLILKDIDNVVDAFDKKVPLTKSRELIAIPTTCGTGSEVTNITIAEIKSRSTKMGLATEELFPDYAVLVPEFLKSLPYKYYIYSSIDALIHAIESHVSPRSNHYTQIYSSKAIETILDIYLGIIKKGEEYRFEKLEDMLIASNYAGIAFGNTGVGAVHALSYPLGGKYHVPHGEANYQLFTEVFKTYNYKKPNGRIKEVNLLLSNILRVSEDKVYIKLEEVLGELLPKNPLKTYGMTEEEIQLFADSVLNTQQRLLSNNYVELSREDILSIYKKLY
ncbi:4-hydroxybutyrate dehydrogenase [Alkaliphilus pronyensis]|uniref:4-hydroxybutyrate dehydrogenase n=1 Tax=Alkaliphilus pronyensis TaxID=1482732 RepID=A0A6I0F1Q7_9FIRM|nr:4-hydroxybutyrate dehydrogenase [Alkaliphilus pronyensis]KAB3530479.1 4-hydroxybutyrate dehydrogenase [Alkaliphilus pronyensis]